MKFPNSECTICHVELIRRWDNLGREVEWTDKGYSRKGLTPGLNGPEGVETAGDYLEWLKTHDMRGYSSFRCQVDLGSGILPWHHWHQVDREKGRPVWETGDVYPEDCCGQPMWLVSFGWLCRSGKHASGAMDHQGRALC